MKSYEQYASDTESAQGIDSIVFAMSCAFLLCHGIRFQPIAKAIKVKKRRPTTPTARRIPNVHVPPLMVIQHRLFVQTRCAVSANLLVSVSMCVCVSGSSSVFLQALNRTSLSLCPLPWAGDPTNQKKEESARCVTKSRIPQPLPGYVAEKNRWCDGNSNGERSATASSCVELIWRRRPNGQQFHSCTLL